MADGVLTVTYNTTNGNVKLSGIVVTDAIRRELCRLGIIVRDGDMQGTLSDKSNFSANTRGSITTRFNEKFNQDPNPYHSSDNLTIAFTAE